MNPAWEGMTDIDAVARRNGMTIVVEVKNEILGNSEFWRGDESRIAEIRNIPARETAKQVAADGKPRVCGTFGRNCGPTSEVRPRSVSCVEPSPSS